MTQSSGELIGQITSFSFTPTRHSLVQFTVFEVAISALDIAI